MSAIICHHPAWKGKTATRADTGISRRREGFFMLSAFRGEAGGAEEGERSGTGRAEVAGVGILELGLVKKLMEAHQLLLLQLFRIQLRLRPAPHLLYQPPCSPRTPSLSTCVLRKKKERIHHGNVPRGHPSPCAVASRGVCWGGFGLAELGVP